MAAHDTAKKSGRKKPPPLRKSNNYPWPYFHDLPGNVSSRDAAEAIKDIPVGYSRFLAAVIDREIYLRIKRGKQIKDIPSKITKTTAREIGARLAPLEDPHIVLVKKMILTDHGLHLPQRQFIPFVSLFPLKVKTYRKSFFRRRRTRIEGLHINVDLGRTDSLLIEALVAVINQIVQNMYPDHGAR
jgi:hypothetical protein